jgi:hypothetical protein
MKKLFLTIVTLASLAINAQDAAEPTAIATMTADKIQLTSAGFTDFIVVPVENTTQAELYKKTLDWINMAYKSPDDVIKGKIENDYIRLEGSSPSLVAFNPMGKFTYLTRYQIEVSFKDGKYKFDPMRVEYYIPANQYGTGGWKDLVISNGAEYYNKKGELKKNFKYIPDIATYFSALNEELKAYLSGDTPAKKSDW